MNGFRPRLVAFVGGKVAALILFASGSWPAAFGAWFAMDAWLFWQMFCPSADGLGPVVTRFKPGGKEVWLTIDDGPDPGQTPAILELLAAHEARATFFVIGRLAAAHPELIRAMLAGGHEVALHTHTHPAKSFWIAGPQRVARELDQNIAAVRAAGVRPRLFRAPVGLKSVWLHPALAGRRLICVAWSTRGRERSGPDAQAVCQRLWRKVEPGAILLMHEGEPVPPAIRVVAIQQTLERLTREGYRAVIPRSDQFA